MSCHTRVLNIIVAMSALMKQVSPPLERKLLNFVIIPLPDGDFNGVVANSRFQNRCLLMYPNALYNQKFKDDRMRKKKKANNKTPEINIKPLLFYWLLCHHALKCFFVQYYFTKCISFRFGHVVMPLQVALVTIGLCLSMSSGSVYPFSVTIGGKHRAQGQW